MGKCPSCQHEIETGTKICPGCNWDFEKNRVADPPAPEPVPAPAPPEVDQPAPESESKNLLEEFGIL